MALLWRTGRLRREWVLATAIGLTAGLCAYAGMAGQMGRGAGDNRVFRPLFPATPRGNCWAATSSRSASSAALVVVAMRRRGASSAVIAAVVLSMGIVGPSVLAPTDLYTRFVHFATPALALAVAAGVRQHPRIGPVLAAVATVAMLAPTLGRWTDDELRNRELAEVAVGRVCGIGHTAGAIEWYEPSIVDGIDCPTVAILARRSSLMRQRLRRSCGRSFVGQLTAPNSRGRTAADCPEASPT